METREFKSAHSCRVCGRRLEGEWSRADAAQRVELGRQMAAGVRGPCREELDREMAEHAALADDVIELGRLALDFGRVDRITYHPDGETPESDTDHTVMLGLLASALAAQYLPGLDVGKVAQYALVHDLVEVYAGDMPTLVPLSADAKERKRAAEDAAAERIDAQFRARLPWVADAILAYERRADPESRFVKALDKLLPKITHILNQTVTIHEQGMTRDQLVIRYRLQLDELREYAADFPLIFDLRQELAYRVLAVMGREAA